MMRLGSSTTSSRAGPFPGRYRRIAPDSQVDETLFGNSNRGNSACKVRDRGNKEGETVRIITKDLVRHLRIPLKDPSGCSVILPAVEFKRIASASRVLPSEEREAMKQSNQKKKEEELIAAETRKQEIFKADLFRKKNSALTELELEAQDRAQRLVERANALKMEQEDEVKKLNQLILGAQCQATCDAQIQEKRLIHLELAEEDKRLDAIMEQERRKALEAIDKIDELRKQQRIRGMQQIHDQIQQHLEEKQLQEEIKYQEGQQIRENQERMNLEDLKALEKKREEQRTLQEEIRRINSETVQAREQRIEQEKLADLRDMEFIQKKMQRDTEYEAEQRQLKKEKELEITRLRAQQQKAKDYKAEQDELRARRNQEAMDREWRRKEKELATKRVQEQAMLRAARLEQVHRKEHCLSINAMREKAEFERVLKVQHEAIKKQKEQEERLHQKAQSHAHAIRKQMQDRELSAIAKRRETFTEASRLMEETQQRQLRLDEIKKKKLKELKATGLSEKYCREVERKAHTLLV